MRKLSTVVRMGIHERSWHVTWQSLRSELGMAIGGFTSAKRAR